MRAGLKAPPDQRLYLQREWNAVQACQPHPPPQLEAEVLPEKAAATTAIWCGDLKVVFGVGREALVSQEGEGEGEVGREVGRCCQPEFHLQEGSCGSGTFFYLTQEIESCI